MNSVTKIGIPLIMLHVSFSAGVYELVMLIHTDIVNFILNTMYLSTEGQLGWFCFFTVAHSTTVGIFVALRHLEEFLQCKAEKV